MTVTEGQNLNLGISVNVDYSSDWSVSHNQVRVCSREDFSAHCTLPLEISLNGL